MPRFSENESLFKTMSKLVGILTKTYSQLVFNENIQLAGNNNNIHYHAFLINWYQNITVGGISSETNGNLKIKMIICPI